MITVTDRERLTELVREMAQAGCEDDCQACASERALRDVPAASRGADWAMVEGVPALPCTCDGMTCEFGAVEDADRETLAGAVSAFESARVDPFRHEALYGLAIEVHRAWKAMEMSHGLSEEQVDALYELL